MRLDGLSRERGHTEGVVQRAGATQVRWVVMAIVMAIMAVTALNRLNLSIAGKYIEEEFSFSTISMGTVFSAFLWGYGLFQIPWGYVCDRIGPRRTLTASIVLRLDPARWSLRPGSRRQQESAHSQFFELCAF